MSETILSIKELTKSFYAVHAVDNVSLDIYKSELLGIIGPNGSGKTTLFNCITGIYSPDAGRIIFKGEDISKKPMDEIANMGIRRTFQTIRLFKDMSVAENIYSGYYNTSKQGAFAAFTHFFHYNEDERIAWGAVRKMAEFFKIDKYINLRASDLAYGLQRKVEMARAMIAKPDVLILDEPAAGMNKTERLELTDMIRKISTTGTAVLIIEHDIDMMMSLCHRIAVFNQGTLLAEGLPSEVQSNKAVIEAYMGADNED
ncbi:ABC transporter ATP-binding protein [Deferribacterales bacterium RsTz2092]|nr:ABC transporter ATP-binding protein [Deferribacterales bacterium]